jgi:hypothetical protein
MVAQRELRDLPTHGGSARRVLFSVAGTQAPRRILHFRQHGSAESGISDEDTTAATFKIGEHVSWNPEAGYVNGYVVAVQRRDVEYTGYR